MLRWSDETRTLELSVRDLAGRGGGTGQIALSRGARARLGMAVHQPADEASWRHVELVDGWHCVVNARVDGLVEELDDYTVIEEIKSVAVPERALDDVAIPASWTRQVQAYLHVAEGCRRPGPVAHLRLVSIIDGSQRVVPVPRAPGFGEWLHRWLAARVRAREQWIAHAAGRQRWAISFPFDELRPGQAELLEASESALHRATVMALEAPTGLGKTAPVLVGALRAAVAQDLGLFWATARTTQRWIVERTLEALDLPLRTVVVEARAQACAACARGECEGSAEIVDLSRLAEAGRVPRELVQAEAARQGACPWALAVEFAAQLADVVIGDLNYAFDPDSYLRPLFGKGAARRWAVLLDEAHQLPERARDWASTRIDDALVDRVIAAYPGADGAAFRDLAEATRAAAMDDSPAWPDLLASFDEIAVTHARLGRPVEGDPWFELARGVQRFATYADRDGEEVVVFHDGQARVLFCRDPSFLLAARIEAVAAVVAMSATLEPPWFWRARCGVEESRFASLRLPSGFPAQNRATIIARSVSTAYRDRAAEAGRIAALLDDCVAAVPGNVALFFGSFEQMDALLSQAKLAGRDRLVQRRDMSHHDRADLAASMTGRDKVLCAVLGGALAESIDLPPGALDAAIIVGPALPPPGLEQSLLQDYYERRFSDGFGLASIHAGMTRVVQAAGRVVRGPADRGAVVLVCRRFQQHAFQAYFPPEWVPVPTSRPATELAAFFASFTKGGVGA
ncbi:MAG: hypothetical protein FJ102_14145 [Deltaproteobacteria bacterium]|nr:hypothetical protein [Deltaproteobacteria bacterium]